MLGSGDSVPVLMHVTFFFYESLCNSAMDIHIAIANALTTKGFNLNDVKVLHCVTEEGKEFQTEHVLGTKE